jgi:4-diphosphocytidyl-2-C-methyl-D-erythritol kinase
MKSISDVLAPAKINLFLHINQKRSDGYHLLQSVFMMIDWYDRLHFELLQDERIERIDLNLDKTQRNQLPAIDLCVKAAHALQKASKCTKGARILLEKHIPQQAGMGGGSSNAASTLIALNRLWDLNLSRQELIKIALPLGADIPFFLLGTNAWVEGIGEKLKPIKLEPHQWVVLKPKLGVSTQEIFQDPQLQRSTKTVTIFDFAAQPIGFGRNDLQPVAQRLCPQIGEAINWLAKAGLDARMTGSGSAVFANLPKDVNGASIISFLEMSQPNSDWELRVCSNLDNHPLADWVSSDK